MLTWLIYALIAVAIAALLPFAVLGWWDVVERWHERNMRMGGLPGLPKVGMTYRLDSPQPRQKEGD